MNEAVIGTADTLVRLWVIASIQAIPNMVGLLVVGLTVAYCHALWSSRKK